MSDNICAFCFKSPSDTTPWCANNPGDGCTYGLHHEFPGGEHAKPKPKQPPKKADKQVCIKCSLHAKNPASAASECQHEYPT